MLGGWRNNGEKDARWARKKSGKRIRGYMYSEEWGEKDARVVKK